MNSDRDIVLLYRDNAESQIMQAVADGLLPFPCGLISDIVMVVANPAIDSNSSNWINFARGQYQGTVVWSFQTNVMTDGLVCQLSFCDSLPDQSPQADTNTKPSTQPEWCNVSQLVGHTQPIIAQKNL